MAAGPLMFIFLCLQIYVNGEVYPETVSNSFESHASEISAVINHLNSSSFKVYNYKEATLLHAHTKADITELALDVNVECVNKYPDIPCTEKLLTCHAFVRNAPEGSQVLNEVNCKPKPEITVDEASYEPPTGPTEVEVNEAKSVALSGEAVSSEVSEPFVAVRKDLAPCLGCPFDVNPDAEGVDELVDLALEHVGTERPNKQALVRVLKVQQQVVSGVKYILVAELRPTVCSKDSNLNLNACPLDPNSETAICEIVYVQKPWISKAKHIISNNCTSSQEYVRDDDKKSEMSNEVDVKGTPSRLPVSTPNFDRIAESGNLELPSPRLSDLESQILLDLEQPTPTKKTAPKAVAPSLAPEIEERFEIDPTPALAFQTPDEVVVVEDDPTTPEIVTEKVEVKPKEPDSSEESKSSSEEDTRPKRSEEKTDFDSSESKVKQANSSEESAETETTPNPVVSEVKQADSSEESEAKARRRRAIPQLEKISPDEKPLVKNLADFAAAALDNIDDDNHKRIILQILGAKKMVGDDGVYYHLIMRMGVSRCLEDKPPNLFENCREKLFENYTKICKVQVYVNDDFTTPKVVKSQCQNIKRDKNDSNRTNYSRFRRGFDPKRYEVTNARLKRQIPGGHNPISKDDEDVKKYLESGLTHIDSQSDHDNKYKVHDVISATLQVVAGFIYRIQAKIILSDCKKTSVTNRNECDSLKNAQPKTCNFVVFETLFDGRLTNITCGSESYAYNEKPEPSTARNKRQAVGEEYEPSGDHDLVDEYLEDGLSQLDAQSYQENKYKVHEVLSVTKQVVAGHIYKIKAKVVLTDCKKTLTSQRRTCGALKGAQPRICNFKIYEALWIPNSRRINFTCEDDETDALLAYSRNTELLGNDDTSVHFALFNHFIAKYNKKYSKREFKYRFKVFSDNLYHIRLLNRYEQGTAMYGITQFTDMTQKEFSKSLGLRMDLRNENEPPLAQAKIPDVEIPTEFDWRKKGAVTEVKNQEQCGSCWAFSVTGNVEGQYAIKHGKLLEFSEQELVDCDTDDQGCNGGLMDNAYRQIEKLGGLETEKDYPYDAQDETCHFNKSLARVQLSGALNISHDEGDMAKWLVANGPISIAINANAMQFYFGGISHPFKFLCSPKNLDHGVLIVGYGVHTYPLFNKTLPFWIVKNSWGTSWGEQGYYRVYRGDGTCGLNQTPSSAIVV